MLATAKIRVFRRSIPAFLIALVALYGLATGGAFSKDAYTLGRAANGTGGITSGIIRESQPIRFDTQGGEAESSNNSSSKVQSENPQVSVPVPADGLIDAPQLSPTDRELREAQLSKPRTKNSAYHATINLQSSISKPPIAATRSRGEISIETAPVSESLIVDDFDAIPWEKLAIPDSELTEASRQREETLQASPPIETVANRSAASATTQPSTTSTATPPAASKHLLRSIGLQRKSEYQSDGKENEGSSFRLPSRKIANQNDQEKNVVRGADSNSIVRSSAAEARTPRVAKPIVFDSVAETATPNMSSLERWLNGERFEIPTPPTTQVPSEIVRLAPQLPESPGAARTPRSVRVSAPIPELATSESVAAPAPDVQHASAKAEQFVGSQPDVPQRQEIYPSIEELGTPEAPPLPEEDKTALTPSPSCDSLPTNSGCQETNECTCPRCSKAKGSLRNAVVRMRDRVFARDVSPGNMPGRHPYRSQQQYYYHRPYNAAHYSDVQAASHQRPAFAPYESQVIQSIHERVATGFAPKSEALLADGYLEFADWGTHKAARREWEQLDHSESEARVEQFQKHVSRGSNQ